MDPMSCLARSPWSSRLQACRILIGGLVALSALLALPETAKAQGGPVLLRVSGSAGGFVSGDYSNTDPGAGIEVAFYLLGRTTRLGVGVEYAEFRISGEPESVVLGSADLLLEQQVSRMPAYVEFRIGYEGNAFDVGEVRWVPVGYRGGAGVGYRFRREAGIMLDVALTASHFLAHTVWANDASAEETVSATRFGARLGLVQNPGGAR